MQLKSGLFISLAWLLCGFTVQETPVGQPSEERQAQESLPQSHDNIWTMFGKCPVSLDAEKYTYSIKYTPEVKALAGKVITVSGFMLPLESTEKFKHFLLSKRTPTCSYCPPGEPNEVVEVFTKEPMAWDEGIVVITGTMKLTNNPDMGVFFQLKNSSSTSIKPYKAKDEQPKV